MAKWTADAVRALLNERNWYESEREINFGTQFVLTDDTRVNCYKTGKVNVQGRDSEIRTEAEVLFADGAVRTGSTLSIEPAPTPKRVFIVYGHDGEAREQLELLLRRLKLEPIVLANIAPAGDTIIEKLEALTGADFACVLLTPDDEGRKRASEGEEAHELRPQARQNVVLELGMVLSRLGRRRVAILLKGPTIEKPSDIDGLIYIEFTSKVTEVKDRLAASLQEADSRST